MVCSKESLYKSSDFVQTIMKLLTANQQDLCFICLLLLKSGCLYDGCTAHLAKSLGVIIQNHNRKQVILFEIL